jgi:hypothetical protein
MDRPINYEQETYTMEQEKSMTNVLQKLSAVRITLSAEEQKFLDYLIVTSSVEDDVVAHGVQTKRLPMATPEEEEDEVTTHRVQTKRLVFATPEEEVDAAAQTKRALMATPEEDEVVAHAVQTKSVTKIIYDAEKSQYRVLRF